MKSEIEDLGRQLRLIYEKGSKECFPLFMGSFQFPKASCEGSSRIFAHIVNKRYPKSKVYVVEGYDRPNNDRHYWVQVDRLVYDLTCDQFDGFSIPILGENCAPLISKFSDLDILADDEIFENWNPGGRYDKAATLEYVEHYLELA
ncbi:hypothetical protein HWV03_12335 [Moritella sp. 36]|uniref:hypothetical protein n=1 Tax=Moritella sp. 36 TaxID=2746233 RepID=UPI001BABD7ED|nr:hypothetical protein [Moritella sp. 36]QUM89531.1 hypothetical protein HWV03_12335 [Moritella sp. 36]